MGIRRGKRAAITGATAYGAAIGAGVAHLLSIADGKCACGDQEFCSCILQPWRAATERLYRWTAGQSAPRRWSLSVGKCPGALHAASESVWHVDLSGRTARHVKHTRHG